MTENRYCCYQHPTPQCFRTRALLEQHLSSHIPSENFQWIAGFIENLVPGGGFLFCPLSHTADPDYFGAREALESHLSEHTNQELSAWIADLSAFLVSNMLPPDQS